MSEELYGTVNSEDAMMHYGVLGMKWGIRRYQNPDGTLTELGKKHQEKAEKEIAKWNAKKEKAIAKGDEKFARKHLDVLTNDDIRRFTERIKARNSIMDLKKDAERIKSEKFKNWLNTASNVVQNASNMATNGVNLYNTVVKINNSFVKDPKKKLTPIGGNDNQPKPSTKVIKYKDDQGRDVTETYALNDKKGN